MLIFNYLVTPPTLHTYTPSQKIFVIIALIFRYESLMIFLSDLTSQSSGLTRWLHHFWFHAKKVSEHKFIRQSCILIPLIKNIFKPSSWNLEVTTIFKAAIFVLYNVSIEYTFLSIKYEIGSFQRSEVSASHKSQMTNYFHLSNWGENGKGWHI